jgi:hypothetical protein
MNSTCLSCNRPLSLAASVMRGLGAICAAKAAADAAAADSGDLVDLPFNPLLKDIVCERRTDGLHFNIYQIFRHHSPTGFEIGYGGSGPADFALNILEIFFRELGYKPEVGIWDKQKVCRGSWALHQQFKEVFVSQLPREGGTIKGSVIRLWIAGKGYQARNQ